MMRKLLAVVAMLAVAGMAFGDGTFNAPSPFEFGEASQQQDPDSICACKADTVKGPALPAYNAENALLSVKAAAGGCSLIVTQVSHDGNVWLPGATYLKVTQFPTYAVYDSLNQGGVVLRADPIVAGSADSYPGSVIPFNYIRLCLIRRTGYATTTASAGPSVACRTRLIAPVFGGVANFKQR